MIKSVQIVNYKSHKDTFLEFSSGINSIIGLNSAGKTNIIKALRIVLFNENWPVKHIRRGCANGWIEVTLTDGTVIKRARNQEEQTIWLTKDGRTTQFDGKADATEFIQKAIGVYKVEIDSVTGEENLNYIDVYDSVLGLLGGRSDTVLRKVAAITGAAELIDAQVELTKQSRAVKTELASLSSQVVPLELDLQVLNKGMEDAQIFFDQASELNQKKNKLRNDLYAVNDYLEKFHTIIDTNIDDLNLQLVSIKTKLEQLEDLNQLLILAQALIVPNNTVDLTGIQNQLNSIQHSVAIKEQLWDYKIKLTEFELNLAEIQTTKDVLLLRQSELEACKKSMKVCPVCDQPIS